MPTDSPTGADKRLEAMWLTLLQVMHDDLSDERVTTRPAASGLLDEVTRSIGRQMDVAFDFVGELRQEADNRHEELLLSEAAIGRRVDRLQTGQTALKRRLKRLYETTVDLAGNTEELIEGQIALLSRAERTTDCQTVLADQVEALTDRVDGMGSKLDRILDQLGGDADHADPVPALAT